MYSFLTLQMQFDITNAANIGSRGLHGDGTPKREAAKVGSPNMAAVGLRQGKGDSTSSTEAEITISTGFKVG